MSGKKEQNHFIKVILQGVFWLLPIAAIIMVIVWVYDKINLLIDKLFNLIGFTPEKNELLWSLLVIAVIVVLLYIIGYIAETKFANYIEKLVAKIPGYSTIKDIIGIFNSSKKGDTKVLVVAIRGFANEGYNLGLMYSQNESIIKDHYTVTLSQTPIPNGGYLFEVHKENIFILEEATFDHNLQYLLSMGVKSLTDIMKVEPKSLESMISLEEYLLSKAAN